MPTYVKAQNMVQTSKLLSLNVAANFNHYVSPIVSKLPAQDKTKHLGNASP